MNTREKAIEAAYRSADPFLTKRGFFKAGAEYQAKRDAAEIERLTSLVKGFAKLTQDMLDAIDGGSVDSQEIDRGDPHIPPHPFHEEWASFARFAVKSAALKESNNG